MDEQLDNSTLQPESNFSLKHLFYGVTLVAVGMSLHNLTIAVSALFLWMWFWTKGSRNATLGLGKAMAAISAFLIVVSMLLASSVRVRGGHGHAYCQSNVSNVLIAMLNYESVHQALPKATYVSDSGIPYSWRVELLPQLELQNVQDMYNFDEPWDSPTNLKLLNSFPNPYCCTFQPDRRLTNYKLVVGPGTAFDNTKPPTKFGELMDGSSSTIAIVEDHTSVTPWTKPEDLTIERAMKLMNDPPPHRNLHAREYAFHYDRPSIWVGFLDSHVEWYFPGYHPAVRSTMFTCADGIPDNWSHSLKNQRPKTLRRPRTDRYVVLFLYPLLAFLPAIIAFFRPQTTIEKAAV